MPRPNKNGIRPAPQATRQLYETQVARTIRAAMLAHLAHSLPIFARTLAELAEEGKEATRVKAAVAGLQMLQAASSAADDTEAGRALLAELEALATAPALPAEVPLVLSGSTEDPDPD